MDGNEVIQTKPPQNLENPVQLIDKKSETLRIHLQRGPFPPKYPPMRKWIFNSSWNQRDIIPESLVIDECLIPQNVRLGIKEGRLNVLDYLIEHNPFIILVEVYFNTIDISL